MPFFYRSHTEKIFKGNNGLKINHAVIYAIPTHFMNSIKQLKNLINIFYKKIKAIGETDISKRRAFSSVSFPGSLTVEAALVLPFFLGAMLILTGVFQVLEVYEEVNSYLCSTGRKLAAYSECYDGADAADLYRIFYAGLYESDIDSENITGGMAGLIPMMKKESDLIQIQVRYGIQVKGYFIKSRSVFITDSVYVCPWIGASPGGKADIGDKNSKIVYVAENGVVYHQNENCTYLALSIHQCRLQDIPAKRNHYGAKYIPCERCGGNASENDTVYITSTGRAWHTDRQCSGLKRNLHTMTQDEADQKGLRACSRCGHH